MPRALRETQTALDRRVVRAMELIADLALDLRFASRYSQAATAGRFWAEMQAARARDMRQWVGRMIMSPPRKWTHLKQ